MPKHKKKNTNRGSWTEDAMKTAIQLILSKENSIRKIAKQYDIPVSTLHEKVSDLKKGLEINMSPKLGRFECTFPIVYENALVGHVINLDKRLMPLSKKEFLKLAFDLAESLAIPHRFSTEKRSAGKDFYYSFIKRHPELSLRKPESTSLARAVGFNKPQVEKFFTKYDELRKKYNFQYDRIFNCDETGISCVHENSMVISLKGKRQVGKLTSLERGKNITILFCMSPSGVFIPPMFVFPRQRMNMRLMINSPEGSFGVVQKSGWMDGKLFLIWLKHFVEKTKPTADSPVLLILDGHGSHKDFEVISFARAHYVHMLSLTPHTSHKLQPLDRTFMKPFKLKYSEECALWMRKNPGLRISEYEIAGLVHETYKKVCNLEVAKHGFSSTGIHPFYPQIFTDADYEPSMTTDVPQNKIKENNTNLLLQENNSPPEAEILSQIEQLMPLPDSTERRIVSRKRRSERSEIFTGNEYFEATKRKRTEKEEAIKQKEKKKQEREEKKKALESKKKEKEQKKIQRKENQEKKKKEKKTEERKKRTRKIEKGKQGKAKETRAVAKKPRKDLKSPVQAKEKPD